MSNLNLNYMKKEIVKKLFIIGILFLVLSINVTVYAVSSEEGKLEVNLIADTSNVEVDGVVNIDILLTNFENIDLNEPIAITAKLDYDENIFSGVTLKPLNGWAAEFNDNKLVLDKSTIVEGQKIATISLEIKDAVTENTSTVKLIEINVVNDDKLNMENLTATVNLNLIKQEKEDNDDENNTVEDDEIVPPVSNIQPPVNTNNDKNEKNEDESNLENTKKIEKVDDLTTVNDRKMPQTGSGVIIYCIFIAAIVLGILSYIKYKRMLK